MENKQMTVTPTLLAYYTLRVRADLGVPQDKLIDFLKGDIDLKPCLNVTIEDLPEGFEVHDCIPHGIDPVEIKDIFAGEDGDDAYTWDGSKLTKL